MIKKIFGSLAVTSLCAAPLLIACGSSGVSSGVDRTKQGKDLTNEETVQVCEAIVDYGTANIDACKVAGLTAATFAYIGQKSDADIQAACTAAVSECGEGSEVSSTTVCKQQTTQTSCTATIADVETCATETIDAQAEAFNSLPDCGTYNKAYFQQSAQGGDPGTAPEQSTACKNVTSNCPVVLTLIGATTLPGTGGFPGGAGGAGAGS